MIKQTTKKLTKSLAGVTLASALAFGPVASTTVFADETVQGQQYYSEDAVRIGNDYIVKYVQAFLNGGVTAAEQYNAEYKATATANNYPQGSTAVAATHLQEITNAINSGDTSRLTVFQLEQYNKIVNSNRVWDTDEFKPRAEVTTTPATEEAPESTQSQPEAVETESQFKNLVGTWKNANGEVLTIDANGLINGKDQLTGETTVYPERNATAYNVKVPGGIGNYGLEYLPINALGPGDDGVSDKTKERIVIGQAGIPTADAYFYRVTGDNTGTTESPTSNAKQTSSNQSQSAEGKNNNKKTLPKTHAAKAENQPVGLLGLALIAALALVGIKQVKKLS